MVWLFVMMMGKRVAVGVGGVAVVVVVVSVVAGSHGDSGINSSSGGMNKKK